MPLTFNQLRLTNATRASRWNGGDPQPLDFAMMELAGETGEACNAAKKIARLQRGMAGGSDESDNLAEELADVVICADLAAIRAGIDLGAAIVAKFNKTSEKHGFPERLYSGRVRLANICNCDLHCRRWNPDSGRCENCGRRIEAGA